MFCWRFCLWICLAHVASVECHAVKECSRISDTSQCYAGEICSFDKCEPAVPCKEDLDCVMENFTTCVSGFCQEPCLTRAQCAHGQKCSDSGKCTYPTVINASEGKDVRLRLLRPFASCRKILWFRYEGPNHFQRLAQYKKTNQTVCYGESESCPSRGPAESSKFQLDNATGDLTIQNLDLNDGGNYYVLCDEQDEWPKYNLQKLNIHVPTTNEDVAILGLPESVLEGQEVDFNCTISRILPPAKNMFWILNGQMIKQSVETFKNEDGTFRHSITFNYTFGRKDHWSRLYCVVIPGYGSKIRVRKIVKVFYSPSGKPKIVPDHLSKNKGEEVLLTCDADDSVDAKPRCDKYIWDKIDKNDNDENRAIVSNKRRDSRWLKIFMTEKFEGKYKCKCANDFGESEFSDVAVLWLRNTTSAIVPRKDQIIISGLQEVVESGTTLELTCIVTQIKPEASQMYWRINGHIYHGSGRTPVLNDGGDSLAQQNTVYYTAQLKHNGAKVECIIVPLHGDPVICHKILNITPDSTSRGEPLHHYVGFTLAVLVGPVLVIFIAVVLLKCLYPQCKKKLRPQKVQSYSPVLRTDALGNSPVYADALVTRSSYHHYECIPEVPAVADYLVPVARAHLDSISDVICDSEGDQHQRELNHINPRQPEMGREARHNLIPHFEHRNCIRQIYNNPQSLPSGELLQG